MANRTDIKNLADRIVKLTQDMEEDTRYAEEFEAKDDEPGAAESAKSFYLAAEREKYQIEGMWDAANVLGIHDQVETMVAIRLR